MKTEQIYIPISDKEQTSAMVAVPRGYEPGEGRGVVLAHGAGNDMNHPLIVAMAEGLAAAGYLTLRFNFLYRERGRKGPDRQEILVQTWQRAHEFLQNHPEYRPKTILAAGKSMGGRVASQMVAEGLLPVARLVFLGYPLHPPGKKEHPRDSHFSQIKIPMLFFSGTRDSLCHLATLENALERLPGPWELQVIVGGDHSFRLPKSADRTQDEVYEQILQKTVEWLGE